MRLAVMVLALSVSACAFTNVPINLPTSGVSPNLSGGDGREVIMVIPFADERQIRERCGMQKNSFNQDTASAICSAPPAEWIANILASELKAAGFSVVMEGAISKSSAVRLQGSLLKIFVEPVIGFTTVSLETDIQVKLVATSKTGLVAERNFFVKGTKSGLAGTQSNFQNSVEDATRQIMKEVVAAIISLMNRYPQLGLNTDQSPTVNLALRLEE